MTFSRAQDLINVREHAKRRARIQAKKGSLDFALKHNDEVLDAKNKNYVKLDKRVIMEITKYQTKAKERRLKRIA